MKRLLLTAAIAAAAILPALGQEELLTNGDFKKGLEKWTLIKLEGAQAQAEVTNEGGNLAAHITVPNAAEKRYFVQLSQRGVNLPDNRPLKLTFRARSKPAGEVVALLATQNGKFEELCREDHIQLTADWKDYSFEVKPKNGDTSGIFLFSGLAAQTGELWFADVSLKAKD